MIYCTILIRQTVCSLRAGKSVHALIAFVSKTKYLGVYLCDDWSDDEDIERQRRSLLSNANRIIREFALCSDSVKSLLFKTFCTNMYCSQLWYKYKALSLSRIRVAYNNCLRKLYDLSYRCSASNMFVTRCYLVSIR